MNAADTAGNSLLFRFPLAYQQESQTGVSSFMKAKPAPNTVTVEKNLRRKELLAAQKERADLQFRASLAPILREKHHMIFAFLFGLA
jgi:hypothetical protein